MADGLEQLLAAHGVPADYADTVKTVHRPIADRIIDRLTPAGRDTAPSIVGICGCQGSGKTAMTAILSLLLAERGWRAMTLSLDDLYLGAAARRDLAAAVHPLLRTRGVPGTHDVAAGETLLDAAGARGPFRTPRFDKAVDDLCPAEQWPVVAGPVDVVLFEGWCVGALPQPDGDLARPINRLERNEDPDGRWRRYVNAQLAGGYRSLFARIGQLILLAAPDFAVVAGWRREQEDRMRADLARAGRTGGQPLADIDRFVMHYERITRHILAEMPARADVVIELDTRRRVRAFDPENANRQTDQASQRKHPPRTASNAVISSP